jgi:hypothetical protein
MVMGVPTLLLIGATFESWHANKKKQKRKVIFLTIRQDKNFYFGKGKTNLLAITSNDSILIADCLF